MQLASLCWIELNATLWIEGVWLRVPCWSWKGGPILVISVLGASLMAAQSWRMVVDWFPITARMLFISELHFLPCFMRSNVIPYLPLCHCTWHESGFDPSCSMRDHRHKQTFPLLGCHFFISCNLSDKLVAREIALTYCHTHYRFHNQTFSA